MKKISIIGLGFVGLPLACILADKKKKYEIVGVDKKIRNSDKNNIKKFILPFKKSLHDKKMISLFNKLEKNKRFYLTNSFSEIANSEVIVVSVNFDFKISSIKKSFLNLKKICKKIALNITENTLIILETTLPPGTSEKIISPIIFKTVNKRGINIKKIFFAYSYERVMPGKNYYDSIVNINRCFSGLNENSARKCEEFLKSFINTKKFPLHKLQTLKDCETSKILENTYRATNIAFIDEWTKYASSIGVNLNNIIEGIRFRKSHNNIMNPGLGVGGYCLTKDPKFIEISCKYLFKSKLNFPLTLKSLRINKNMPNSSIDFLDKYLPKKKLNILILGASYRQDIGDIRSSASIDLFKKLRNKENKVLIYDPMVNETSKLSFITKKLPNFKNYDVIIFSVAHTKFKNMRFSNFSKKPYYFDLNLVLSKRIKNFLKKNNYKLKVLGDD